MRRKEEPIRVIRVRWLEGEEEKSPEIKERVRPKPKPLDPGLDRRMSKRFKA